MQVDIEAMRNGYPLEAVKFFDNYDEYLNDKRDEYGFKTATPDCFKEFDEVEKGLSKKLYEKYLRCVKAIKKYNDKGGGLYG